MAKQTEKKPEKDSDSNAIAIYDGEPYAIVRQDVSILPEILEANIGNPENLNEFDLDRVSMPSGGGLAWMVTNIDGEPEPLSEIEGVILLHGDRRAYWSIGFNESGGGSPPDCSSMDAKTGVGRIPVHADLTIKSPNFELGEVESRSCKTCPMSQWGSYDPDKESDNRQACNQRKILYIIRKDDILPLVISLAPTSIRGFNQFMLRLTSRMIPSYGAIIGLKLRQESSSGGITYSVVHPRLISVLSDGDRARMKAAADAMRPFFDRTGVDPMA